MDEAAEKCPGREHDALAEQFPAICEHEPDDSPRSHHPAAHRGILPYHRQRLADPQSQPEGRVAFALSVSPNGNSAAIAVAGTRADGLEHIEIAYHDQGTGWVIDEVLAMAARNDGFVLAVPASGPAGPVVAMLEREGVTVVAAKTTDASNACGGLLIAARDGRLRHRGQRSLDVAVAGAKRKEIGDSWVWGRKTSTSDVSPLEAVTLARWALGSVSEKPAPLVFAY